MAKGKAEIQITSLIPDHKNLGIDPTLVCAGKMRHIIEKVSTRATTLLQTSSRLEV
jgi:hypothetical protein